MQTFANQRYSVHLTHTDNVMNNTLWILGVHAVLMRQILGVVADKIEESFSGVSF